MVNPIGEVQYVSRLLVVSDRKKEVCQGYRRSTVC